MKNKDLRKYSKIVVDGVEQAPSRAMLRAVGFEDEDFKKPQIGIASTWSMVTPAICTSTSWQKTLIREQILQEAKELFTAVLRFLTASPWVRRA